MTIPLINAKRPDSHELRWPAIRRGPGTGGGDVPIEDMFSTTLLAWKEALEQMGQYVLAGGQALEDNADRIIDENNNQWIVDPEDGDLVPSGDDQGIGTVDNQPRFIGIRSEDNVRGALIGALPADGDMMVLAGFDETALGRVRSNAIESNRPVKLDGSAILLDGDAGYAFRVPPGTPPADVEEHYAKFGTMFTGPDGKTYVTLEVGPLIPVAQSENFQNPTDWDLADGLPQVVVGSALALTYTTTTTFKWVVNCANLGDRSVDFSIQPLHNGAPLGSPTVVTLSGGEQLATGNTIFPAPPVAADTVAVEVTAFNFAHPNRSDPWVLGSSVQSEITISQ